MLLNKSKLYLRQKDRMLLLYSSIIEDHPWLYDLLANNEKFTHELYENASEAQRVFLDNLLNPLITQAVEEWKGEGELVDILSPDRSEWVKCSLCGTPNRFIFYITNKLNGESLNVGSECVKYFGFKIGDQRMNTKQLIKNKMIFLNLKKLNEKFPGIQKVVEQWNSRLESYPIVLPLILENNYLDLGERLRHYYHKYLNQEVDDGVFPQVETVLIERDDILKRIQQYVTDNIDRKYIPGKLIERWLKAKGDYEALEMLKKDGEITWKTVHRIEEPEFMKSLLNDFNRVLRDFKVKILNVNRDSGSYVVEPSVNPKIRLMCKHKKLTLDYGGLLFGEELIRPYDFHHLVEISLLENDENTYISVIDVLKTLSKGSGVRFEEYNIELDRINVFEKSTGKYLIINNLMDFLNKFKNLAFGVGNQSINDMVKYINALKVRRYTKEEMKQYDFSGKV